VRLGYLQPGDQLPTVKDVVRTLAINPNTVMKAYRDLEHRGLAAGRPGQGTFISRSLADVGLPQLAELRKSLLAWLRSAETAGLDAQAIEATVFLTLRQFFAEAASATERGTQTVTTAETA
jgi:GntR family transcriptional regulator